MSDRALALTSEVVLDAVSRAIVATDSGGTILSWNRGAESLYGWAAEEVLGRNVVEVLVPGPLAGQAAAILDEIRVAGRWAGEFHTRHKDGRTVPVAVVNRAVLDDDGRVVVIIGESEDLSTELRLHTELRASRDELQLALTAGRLGILRWDRATGTVTLDPTAEELLGLAAGAFDGTFESWAALLHPDDRDRVLSMLNRAVESRGTYDLEYRVTWPDGSVHWLQGRGQVTLDDDGVVTGRIGCMADITARRLVDQERSHLLVVERAVRAEAETAAARLSGLQAVTMSLIRAVDARSVAEAVLREGVPAVGGRTGSICLVADDGETVEIVHELGYHHEVKARWQTFALAADVPASDAIRTGQMVLLRDVADRDARYPVFRGTPTTDDAATAVVALVDEDETAFGAMAVGFAGPHDFTDSERRLLSALAAQCATALRRAALYEDARESAEAERAARLAAERAQERLAFLAEASSVLASSVLDLDAMLAQVVDLAVPRLATGCAIHLSDGQGEHHSVAVAHADPAQVDALRELAAGGGAAPAGWATTVIPLRSQSQAVGALTLVTEPDHPLGDADRQLAEQLAVRAATAIENARLFAERSRVARSLQASLLPPSLPAIPGLELGARYAPAGEGVEVGGDFYDAFAVDGGCWLLVVGDVKGKGVDAAAVTGLARHTIRSIAMYERRPRAILAHLNRVLLAAEADRVAAFPSCDDIPWELTEPRFCTVALAIVAPGPAGAGVVVCSGGHPLPLLARADGAVEPVGRPGSLLGAAADVELHDVELHLGPGDALVCFTDGIVERHRGRRFFEEGGVEQALREAPGADAATLAARVELAARSLFDDNPHDDMAVLIVRVPPA